MVKERKRQTLVGEVISTKMEKTVNVRVMREIPHPVYHKRVKRYKSYQAHIVSISPEEGDIVRIVSIRPKSKNKSWQVSQVIRKSVKLGR